MNFIIDENLSRGVARALRSHGQQASHCTELAGVAADDRAIWREAIDRGSIIVTEDVDFLAFLAGPPPHATVVRLIIGNCTTAQAVDLLVAHLDEIAARVAAGDRLIVL